MKVAVAKKYKDSLYEALSRDLAEFEKNFLLIAAGVLTFSITFIKDIVNIDKATLLATLFIGWLGFTIAVGLIMVTFLQSAYASDEISLMIENYLQQYGKLNEDDELDEKQSQEIRLQTRQVLIDRKASLKGLRQLAIACFLVGFASFGFFVAYNLVQEKQQQSEEFPAVRIGKDVHSAKVGDWMLTFGDSTVEIQSKSKK